jgi:Xaa-Pro aminopeptidase
VLDPDGSITAIVSEDEAPGVAPGIATASFPGFAVEDLDRASLAAAAALEVLGGARELAVELDSLPGDLALALAGRGVSLTDVGESLRAARAVKDPDEIDALRAAIGIADAGQAAAREAAQAGATELSVWASVRSAMESAAGSRIPVLADLVSGGRTAEVGGPPTDRTLEAGDVVLVDLVPRLGAYWADSCSTVAVVEPEEAARQAHAAAVAALEQAVALCRPGARAADIDACARETIETAGGSYPHHTGHGIGVTFHEEPRIIPRSDRILEEGMVVALEPGAYDDGFGVRVEQVVLVTAAGPEILSGHDLSL